MIAYTVPHCGLILAPGFIVRRITFIFEGIKKFLISPLFLFKTLTHILTLIVIIWTNWNLRHLRILAYCFDKHFWDSIVHVNMGNMKSLCQFLKVRGKYLKISDL